MTMHGFGIRILSAVCAAAALLACTLPQPRDTQTGRRMLRQPELERLFLADRRVEFMSPEGSAVVTYSVSGEQRIEWAGGTDTGTVVIRDDHFCSRWKSLRNGVENCTRVYRVTDVEYELTDDNGAYAATMRVK
jgi:hypothetical protein